MGRFVGRGAGPLLVSWLEKTEKGRADELRKGKDWALFPLF